MADQQANRLALLESVLGAMNLGALVLDSDRRIVLCNRWMARHGALDADTICGRDFFDVYPDLKGKRIDSAISQALRDNFPSLLSQTLHKAPFALFANAAARSADERMQQAVAVTPIAVDAAARHCLIQVSDVSMAVSRERLLREQALELRSQSYSDGLTGIANRRHFDVAMEKEIRRVKRASTPLSLLMIDIDCFKTYNDRYGHQQGDDTLIKVAHALSDMLQRPLDLIARYGGEEFAVILPEMNAEQSHQMAEAMRQRIVGLAIPHLDAIGAGCITVSIGITTHSAEQHAEIADLIGGADRALYQAKRSGRNRVHTATPAQPNTPDA